MDLDQLYSEMEDDNMDAFIRAAQESPKPEQGEAEKDDESDDKKTTLARNKRK